MSELLNYEGDRISRDTLAKASFLLIYCLDLREPDLLLSAESILLISESSLKISVHILDGSVGGSLIEFTRIRLKLTFSLSTSLNRIL
jgi:hypothetical protein